MAEEFKLPGSSYGELVKIIRAYGHSPDDATPSDVAGRIGIDETQVSRNNKFLVSIGILEGGRKKSLTIAGRALAQALDFELPKEIETAWRGLVSSNEFLRKIITAVRIRGGMDLSDLRNHVAYTAGGAKNHKTLTGASSVVDLLKVSGALREFDGKLVAVSEFSAAPPVEIDKFATVGDTPPSEIHPTVEAPGLSASGHFTGSAKAVLSIQVRVTCTPDDLDTLAPKLRKLLDEVNTTTASRGLGVEDDER